MLSSTGVSSSSSRGTGPIQPQHFLQSNTSSTPLRSPDVKGRGGLYTGYPAEETEQHAHVKDLRYLLWPVVSFSLRQHVFIVVDVIGF
ncbi:hypothetical protein PsYK624_133160 [Phanerochaete sordida]|uniref:Uncharacterized protein n=1 Tax=Phanerochaete sordida TaxID=48140 RepID=A0A9P3LJ78_9APHY|nr:hypothetical protein PsYK624_133160 [Phanerochaete sordida]